MKHREEFWQARTWQDGCERDDEWLHTEAFELKKLLKSETTKVVKVEIDYDKFCIVVFTEIYLKSW